MRHTSFHVCGAKTTLKVNFYLIHQDMASGSASPTPGTTTASQSPELRAFLKEVGQALLRERRQAGLSQQQVAEKMGIEPETVSRIENGVIAPTLARLRQFSTVYGCSLEAIVGQASDQLPDVAKRLAEELEGLPDADRVFVVEQAISAARHIKASRQRS